MSLTRSPKVDDGNEFDGVRSYAPRILLLWTQMKDLNAYLVGWSTGSAT
jgi:hypothetical protein